MRKRKLSLFLVGILITLFIPAASHAKTNSTTAVNNTKQESSTDKDIILVKDILDSQYNDIVDTNNAFLQENIVDRKFDYTTIIKELKTKKDCIIISTYNKNLKNNTYSYSELLDKITDILYPNCCSSLLNYEKEALNSVLHEKFGEKLLSGDKCIKTMLFAAQNKKTGLFLSFTPVTIEIKAEQKKLDDSLTYYAEIKAVNYLVLGRR